MLQGAPTLHRRLALPDPGPAEASIGHGRTPDRIMASQILIQEQMLANVRVHCTSITEGFALEKLCNANWD